DVVARLGGDEFTVLLPGARAAKAREIADRIHAAVADPIQVPGATVSVSACIGIAVAPDDAGDYKSLLHAADAAMYRAKRGGGRRSLDPTTSGRSRSRCSWWCPHCCR